YANRASDRIVAPLPLPGQKTVAPRFRLLDRDGIACVGDYILPGDVVLVVGASNSGEDISRELSAAGAERVLLSARSWQAAGWAEEEAPYGPGGNIHRYPMVSELHADGSASFEGGRRYEGRIDTVIYCTGYSYSFPFLRGAAAAAAAVDDNRVGRLWLDILPLPAPEQTQAEQQAAAGQQGGASPGSAPPLLAPGLSFLGLPWKVVPFPQFELQSKLVARLLSGRASLGPLERMQADVEARTALLRERGLPTRYAHMQNLEQFAYNQALAALCGPDVAPSPAWREQLYRATSALKRARPDDYRDSDLAMYGGEAAAAALAEAEAETAAWLAARLEGREPGAAAGAAAAGAVAVEAAEAGRPRA
ncbi:Flavin-containing monooxygenase FMO GS-OX-like 4, partial [Tetrabaena socialis]